MILALLSGLCILAGLAKRRSFSFSQILGMCARGIKTTRGLLILFVLVGVLTSLWRASGTIPVIVSCATHLIHPQSFILVTFLLNCAMSLLTGTSLGTAATMGVICATSVPRHKPHVDGWSDSFGGILWQSAFSDFFDGSSDRKYYGDRHLSECPQHAQNDLASAIIKLCDLPCCGICFR